MPKVTVLLCVHNAENYIDECINSILVQSFEDFELLIVDDGSTDNTLNKLMNYPDSRIRIIQRDHGYIDSLNYGLHASTGEYIARMDADDL